MRLLRLSTMLFAALSTFPLWAGPSQLYSFFENSLRRDPISIEADGVVKVGSATQINCSAFFVSNSQKQALLMSANHCFQGKIREQCQAGNLWVFDHQDRPLGYCQETLIENQHHDMVLFKMKVLPDVYLPQGLSLAKYDPRPGLALKEIGFPSDRFRNSKITVSDNCWVLKAPYRYAFVPPRWDTPAGRGLTTRLVAHNCSTYGGNSGGPLIQVGSTTVMGLPDSYFLDDFTLYSAQGSSVVSEMAVMSDFVLEHESTLKALGVKIDQAPDEKASAPSGAYRYLDGVQWGQAYAPEIKNQGECAFIPRWSADLSALEIEYISQPQNACPFHGFKTVWQCLPWPNRSCTYEEKKEYSDGTHSWIQSTLMFNHNNWILYEGILSAKKKNVFNLIVMTPTLPNTPMRSNEDFAQFVGY